MSRKKKRTEHASHNAPNPRKKPPLRHATPTPEQLIEQGKLPEAIRLLEAELKQMPSDDQRRRLLGHCFYQREQYEQAASTWLTLRNALASDVTNVGVAFLNAQEWDQAIEHLEKALQQEEHARTYYLLALAHLRETKGWHTDEEIAQQSIKFLQQARTLPDCPPEVYLLLDRLLESLQVSRLHGTAEEEREAENKAREEHFQLFEEGFSRYPDHERIRVEFAKTLIDWRKQYETGLLVLSPLLQKDDLEEHLFEEAIGLSVEAAHQAGWYDKALQYLTRIPIGPPVADADEPGMTKLQGDLYLLQQDFTAARASYEGEIQSGSFVARFLGLFSSAWAWLLEEKQELALPLVERALAEWFEMDDEISLSSLFDGTPICIGMSYIGNESPALCVRKVCETLLQRSTNISQTQQGQLRYLLYQCFATYHHNRPQLVWEQQAEHEQLLVKAAQLYEHPQVSRSLAQMFEERGDLPMAVEYHLRWCIQSCTRERGGFDERDAVFTPEQEEDFSREARQHIHERAWALLQAHQIPSLIEAIFIPFYRSFWRGLLQAGKMHREIVAVTALFLRMVPGKDTESEQWDYAYFSQEMGDLQVAEGAYRTYLLSQPDSDPALNNLAMILETNGALQEALVLMKQALTLEPEKALYLKNRDRLNKKLGDVDLVQARQHWSQFNDGQKMLLYLTDAYRVSSWSDLLQHIHGEDAQLQEHWQGLIRYGALMFTEGQAATVVPSLLPLVRHEGLLLILIADVIRNTSPRKKHPWVPKLDEFVPDATTQLDKAQRTAFHKAAFKRLQTAESSDRVTMVFLPFYRSTWKPMLTEGKMAQEIVEVTRILTTRVPGQSRPELWDYAYYAHDILPLAAEAEQAYKRYLEGGANTGAYHNLALLAKRSGRFEDALAYAEQALKLEPESENTLRLQASILQVIEQRKQDVLRQKELAEQRERQLENLIRTAPERWAKVDRFKRLILGTMAALDGPVGLRELAHLVEMEERVLKGHWSKLLEQGMVIEEEAGPRVNPFLLDLVRRERAHAVVTRIVHTSTEMMTKPIFNSQQEYKIYSILLEVFPNQLVFPNMALQSIFPYARMQAALPKEIFTYYLMASVDFCVTLTSTYLPLVAFEVDSDYHDSEQQKVKDERKDRIFATGGIALIRLRAFGQPSPQAMRYDIMEAVRAWLREWQTTPHQTGWAINLEHELDYHRFGLTDQEKED